MVPDLMVQTQPASALLGLPSNAQELIAMHLRNPAAYAATCRTIAALLRRDELLVEWAAAWAPRLTANAPNSERRHPGYALLHWRRVHCLSTPRLAALLLRWLAQCGYVELANGTAGEAQQLLDAGDALGALHKLLPHSQHLLLLYAAQTGHMQLLGDLLAELGDPKPDRLHWSGVDSQASQLRSAACAAAREGRLAAMHALLAALDTIGALRSGTDIGEEDGKDEGSTVWRSDLQECVMAAAVEGGSRGAACVVALLQLPRRWSWQHVGKAAELGDPVAVRALLENNASGLETAQYLALKSGNFHLMPLLQPVGCVSKLLVTTIYAWGQGASACVSGDPHMLASCIEAMRHIAEVNDTWLDPWGGVLCKVFRQRSTTALSAMVAAFTAPQELAALAKAVAEAMHRHWFCSPVEVQWVLDNAVPILDGLGAAEQLGVLQRFAKKLEWFGHWEVVKQLQLPPHPAPLDDLDPLLRACADPYRVGQLLRAVRSGDAAAVRVLVQHTDAGGWPYYTFAAAAQCAAELPHAATAQAVAGALGPISHWSYPILPVYPLLAHGGLFAYALCEISPDVQEMVAGPTSNRFLCFRACRYGLWDTAVALVCHPQQQPQYLAAVGASFVTALTELLHRLAALASAAADSSGAGNSRASSSDGEISLAGVSDVGDGGISCTVGRGAAELVVPAGARDVAGLWETATKGTPDLLYAVLRFKECWGLTGHELS